LNSPCNSQLAYNDKTNTRGAKMTQRLLMVCVAALLVSMGCASVSQVKRTDPVAIVLTNGDKIDAEVVDIHNNKVIFKARDWKKAYEYGEVINVERIQAIRLRDGQRLSVREYDAFRKGETVKKKSRVASRSRRSSRIDQDLQYDEIQNKAISEMTDNEFAFFMMMKEKEIEAEKAAKEKKRADSAPAPKPERPVEVIVIGPQDQEPTVSAQSEDSSDKVAVRFDRAPTAHETDKGKSRAAVTSNSDLNAVVKTLFEANLAISMLNHLSNKRRLTPAEASLLELIENNNEWQDQVEDLLYLNRTAKRALERAFLYTPDELDTKLGLEFDKNADMDYLALMAQLHRKLGNDVQMADFRNVLDVFGEGGGRALKELLENYDSWQFVVSKDHGFVTK
ncbi:hypothetical protein MJD09_26830, partial [bacterium]|nr:hypothetical protein [bacterium]